MLCFLLCLLCQRHRRPWHPPGRYGTSTRPVAAFRGFAWSQRYAPSGDVPRTVSISRHGHCICCRMRYILFFRRLESKLVFIFLLYQFIDSIELLRPSLSRIGSNCKIRAAGGGGSSPWWCCLWVVETRKNVLFLRRKSTEGSFFVPARTQIGVKLLMICDQWADIGHSI